MINKDIIRRYLNGEATEKDLRQLQSYLQGEDFSVLEKEMARDWQEESWDREISGKVSDDLWRAIRARREQATRERQLSGRNNRRRWLTAAGFLLAFGLALSLWMSRPEPMITLATGFGEWKTIILPDSSWVKLNANSEISYAQHWQTGAERKVWLKGEAIFKVTKGRSKEEKFKVITDDLEVEVLGTAFNVNSRGIQTDVFLEEGQILLSMGEAEELLQPGDFLAYSARIKAVIKREKAMPPEMHTSWKDGVLRLKDQKVADILAKIEGIYGVPFKVQRKQLLSEVMTVSIPMDKLELAIPILEGTFGAEIIKKEGQLIIQ